MDLQVGDVVRLKCVEVIDVGEGSFLVEGFASGPRDNYAWVPNNFIDEIVWRDKDANFRKLEQENIDLRLRCDDLLRANTELLAKQVQDKLEGKS